MARYICTVCEYVYDEEKGEKRMGIDEGTKFQDLPESWKCPVCGKDKKVVVEFK